MTLKFFKERKSNGLNSLNQNVVRAAALLQNIDCICVKLFPSTSNLLLVRHWRDFAVFSQEDSSARKCSYLKLVLASVLDTGSIFAALDREFKHEVHICMWTHFSSFFKMGETFSPDITSVYG